jgi:hypothetical protein
MLLTSSAVVSGSNSVALLTVLHALGKRCLQNSDLRKENENLQKLTNQHDGEI